MTLEFSSHPVGKTPGIKPVLPTQSCQTENCEVTAQLGIFFDGTGNNMYADLPGQSDSNVARLFRAYPEIPGAGSFAIYVPGVGTPFPAIGEDVPAKMGDGFGGGGDGRINYGLLEVLNSIDRSVRSGLGQSVIPARTILALCRNGKRYNNPRTGPSPLPRGDAEALQKVGMSAQGGLLRDGSNGDTQREQFLSRMATQIGQRINETQKPKLKEIFIDVFGFSRGAAQARVFCTWLGQLFDGETLCGVPAQIRFLGLFDTVASIGMPLSTPVLGTWTDGHLDWASSANLRIPARVKNCVHYIAMHENRASFPVDYVRSPGGALPGNCREYMMPGMHSDVGGGYGPVEQGRGPYGIDSEKLSQIPLGRMYEAAKDAKVPLDKALTETATAYGKKNAFDIHPNLQQAYSAFSATPAGSGNKTQGEWFIPYLAWRYQVRKEYADLPWRERSPSKDVEDLMGANATLLADIAALESVDDSVQERIWNSLLDTNIIGQFITTDRDRADKLAPEARNKNLLNRMYRHEKVSAAAADLFANYMHDSFAGFRPYDTKILGFDPPGSWEPEGYMRLRRFFLGDDREHSGEDWLKPLPPKPPTYQEEMEARRRAIEMKGVDMGAFFNGGW